MKTVRQIIKEQIQSTPFQSHAEWYLNSILRLLEEDGLAEYLAQDEIHIPYEEYKTSYPLNPYVSSPEKIREVEQAFRHSKEYEVFKNLLTPAPTSSQTPTTNYHFLLKASMACAAVSISCIIAMLAVAIFTTSTLGVVLLAAPAAAAAMGSYGFFKYYKTQEPQAEPPVGLVHGH